MPEPASVDSKKATPADVDSHKEAPVPQEPAKPEAANTAFEQEADAGQPSLVSEFIEFLFENKKWWLIPIVVVLFLVGALLVVGGSGAAPFIYTLF
ncbi:DUF5989 family protein [Planctomycetota bacterium]